MKQTLDELLVGFDVPARIGMAEAEIQTPCLMIDLDALERNLKTLAVFVQARGIRFRAHGKMHKSVDIARLQLDIGGACGICCQKVSEAEVFIRGGITDVLITNQVRDPLKIHRLAELPKLGARVIVCVDDFANVAELSMASVAAGTVLECLVEIDCGAKRCGVTGVDEAVHIARAIDQAEGLRFSGVQAYHGGAQHIRSYDARQREMEAVINKTKSVVLALESEGLSCDIVGGGGTGSFPFEAESGVYNELQCGSYAFMDADYGEVREASGERLDRGSFENALFLVTSIMSQAQPAQAICDAGLKVQSVDSGLPQIFDCDDLEFIKCNDEHGIIRDPHSRLNINDKLRLIPGHCDPTCNLHDWYVGVRGGIVETVWPVSARGKVF